MFRNLRIALPFSSPKPEPAMPPVTAREMQAVLDHALKPALERGVLAPWTGGGTAIGVVDAHSRHVFSYGAATTESIFEIGSLTKPFTALMLAQMVVGGTAALDEPVRELLPPGIAPRPAGREITLLDLATQRSGLPRLPSNLKPANRDNPYADYSAARLYAFLAERGFHRPADPPYLYSNLGFGLLGHALAHRSGLAYPDLLRELVTGPLGLADTTIDLTPPQASRLMAGHGAHCEISHPWSFQAMAGAGAIRSTAGDMLAFLQAYLRPGEIAPVPGFAAGAMLPAAIRLSQQVRSAALPGMSIAFAWLIRNASGEYWHNGATGGFSSYAFFQPSQHRAAVVLANRTIESNASFAERLCLHIRARFAARPALSLAN